MRIKHRRGYTIALLVLSLILFGVEAGLWTKPTMHARSETDKANILGASQPNELPAIAGILLLVAAAVVASIPQSRSHG
jgi:hypothetical protein